MKRILFLLTLTLFLTSCKSGRGDQPGSDDQADLKDVEIGVNIGQRAPELVYENPDGETIALSSLRGKMVLIDFWAAWCSPCREENPNLVKTYQKYKDKEFVNGTGFTVYGISLDRNREDWVNAIEKDQLEWESNVSDLKGWRSVAAAQYQVMAIPTNFLIDGDGIIVAKSLKGQYLVDKLEELRK